MALQLLPCAVGSQLSHCEDNEAALWKGPHGEWDLWTTAGKNLPAMRVPVEVVFQPQTRFLGMANTSTQPQAHERLKQAILRKSLPNS